MDTKTYNMKNIYTLSLIFSFTLFLGCSKDFLKKYERRIVGSWRISDVDNWGIGGSTSNLTFKDGTLTFNSDGSLVYVSPGNVSYQGRWDISKKTIDDERIQTLQVYVTNFTIQQSISEFYDDLKFVSTDHFKARINSSLHTYVTHFRRL